MSTLRMTLCILYMCTLIRPLQYLYIVTRYIHDFVCYVRAYVYVWFRSWALCCTRNLVRLLPPDRLETSNIACYLSGVEYPSPVLEIWTSVYLWSFIYNYRPRIFQYTSWLYMFGLSWESFKISSLSSKKSNQEGFPKYSMHYQYFF